MSMLYSGIPYNGIWNFVMFTLCNFASIEDRGSILRQWNIQLIVLF